MPRPLKLPDTPATLDWLSGGGSEPPPRVSKYRAVRTTVGKHVFASKREAARYVELRTQAKGGTIRGLELQPRFRLVVRGVLVATYVADFRYVAGKGRRARAVVEDVKGVRTPVYRLKKKLMKACLDIDVTEV